jgi:L-proline amide hydrolase
MSASFPSQEGWVSFDVPDAGKPVKTYYKVIGDLSGTSIPLIVLHGGPGAGHEYLYPLIDLYQKHKIPIVFYDQIGCAQSTHLPEKLGDERFWSVGLFIRELENLIEKLNVKSRGYYVYGSSWGGMLAGAFAARQPLGLKKLVIASGPCDMRLYVKGLRALVKKLPEEIQNVLEDCEKRGHYEGPEYDNAYMAFAKRFTCRLDPFPEDFQKAFAHLQADRTAELTMYV